jgi:hypothetical protein
MNKTRFDALPMVEFQVWLSLYDNVSISKVMCNTRVIFRGCAVNTFSLQHDYCQKRKADIVVVPNFWFFFRSFLTKLL